MKRTVIGVLTAGLASFAAWPGSAPAQNFPARPVTLIVPWSAGGSTDLGMRALAAATEKHLGQPIVIENRPGGSGTLAPGQMAATAKPDGYTIAQIPITVFRLPFMTRTTFDPAKDFTYIAGLTGYTFGIVVKGDSPWKTFQEFVADAKANPGKISYGTPGAGTTLHLTMEQIAKAQGIKWTHVPFRGTSDSTNALLGGHVNVVADASGWAPLVNSGKLRLLVIWSDKRSKS
ncbi:MAG: tripartite tricarboxylate transporter substrate binding protein, partial [Xanthobacteraceae bacterium]